MFKKTIPYVFQSVSEAVHRRGVKFLQGYMFKYMPIER